MFVEIPVLEVLAPFAIFGFIVFTAVIFKYSYKFGYWVVSKFFGKREYHETLAGKLTKNPTKCYGTIVYDKSAMLASEPPKYKGVCEKCGTVVYSLCSSVG